MNRRNLFKIISFFVFGSIFQSAEAKFTNKIKFPVDALDWMCRCADYLKSEFRGEIFLVTKQKKLIGNIKIDCKQFFESYFQMSSEKYIATEDFVLEKAYLVDSKGYVIYVMDTPKNVNKGDAICLTFTLNVDAKPVLEADFWKA